jgi:hypothetical protein
MIIYDLCCSNDHRFEGWFQSAADFESQLSRDLVCCPQCDSAEVRRIPSAVAIGSHRVEQTPSSSVTPSGGGMGNAMMPAGTQVMAIYRQLVQAMAASSEDVGSSFPEEARKIHYNEAPERAIRGHATEDECEALREEGIPILRMPTIKDEDLN